MKNQEKTSSDAPVWYNADGADGWANGYNAATDDSIYNTAARESRLEAWSAVLWDATGDQTKVDRVLRLAKDAGLL